MKPFRSSFVPLLLAAAFLLPGSPVISSSEAKPDKDKKSKSIPPGHLKKIEKYVSKERSRERDSHDPHHRHHDHDAERRYHSHSRSSFTLNFGSGWAGRGYYYGPPGASYYYQRPEVRYYRTRESAPREYWDHSYRRPLSVGASVQQALARRGYYRGPIDGSIGPYSRSSIARYQAAHGLRPTGQISESLLRSLGL